MYPMPLSMTVQLLLRRLLPCAATGNGEPICVSASVDPKILSVIRTYCFGSGAPLVVLPEKEGLTDLESWNSMDTSSIACLIIQTTNYYGLVEDGADIAVGEGQPLGGTCLNLGCIPTKTLLHSAKLYEEVRDAAQFGISIDHVQADLSGIQEHKQATITTLQKGIDALLKAAKVTIYQGLGTVIDTGASHAEAIKEVQITSDDVDSVTIKTKQILLASGSVPSIPPIPGHDLPGIMTSDELLSWDKEPFSSLLIIGGGVIGMEFAGIWQTLGTKVTILEALPSLIANMDKELGQSLKLSLKKKSADIHTGAKVQSLESTEDGILCTYTEKDTVCTCTAQGLHAVHHIAARSTSDTDSCSVSRSVDPILDLVPSCIYATPEIASVGLTLDQAKEQGLAAKSHKILSSANGKSVLSLQEHGFMKVIYLEETHVIIGAQLLCARATDMISEFAVAIAQKLTLKEMASVIRPHPSFSEMITQVTTL